MDYGVDLGSAGVLDCSETIVGPSQDDVMDQVRAHLGAEHEGLANEDQLLAAIQALIAPIKK
jgi:hypothetical protein